MESDFKTSHPPFDLRERLFLFAKTIINISRDLPLKAEGKILREQLIRAATSIGANYEEADGALTKKDIVHKLVIARKEARETRFFLRLICDLYKHNDQAKKAKEEVGEIIKILSKMISNSSKSQKQNL